MPPVALERCPLDIAQARHAIVDLCAPRRVVHVHVCIIGWNVGAGNILTISSKITFAPQCCGGGKVGWTCHYRSYIGRDAAIGKRSALSKIPVTHFGGYTRFDPGYAPSKRKCQQ